MLVDAGPDPALVDRCLRRLDVRHVPLLVLTHFHADHVDGLAGVLRGRRVGQIEVSPYREPAAGVSLVDQLARRTQVAEATPSPGQTWTVGQVALRVVGPVDRGAPASANPNDASVVMIADIRGVRILLAGDAQTEEMDDLLAAGADLRCDVYKVAHHGSANVDPDFVAATHARLAVISVGADNDYGHPPAQLSAEQAQHVAQQWADDRDGLTVAGTLASTVMSGKRSARCAATAQCVVAWWPSSSPAWARVGIIVVPVPVGQPDATRRLTEIARATAERKRRPAYQPSARFAQRWMVHAMFRQRLVNLLVSKLPGPPIPMHFAGARILEVFQVGVVQGNLTISVGVVSYAGQLNFDVVGDARAVPDLVLFAERPFRIRSKISE